MRKSNLVFAVHDGIELLGDFWRPEGTTSDVPAVLLLHGGGWRGGDKESWHGWARHFCDWGYAALAINYRLVGDHAPRGLFPSSFWDVQAGVKFLRGVAAEYGLSGEVAAMGGSVGGYFAAMLGLATNHPQLVYPYDASPYFGQSAEIEAAIPVCGIYDLLAQWEHDQLARPRDPITDVFLGGTPMEQRELYYLASPIFHASARNARFTKWLIGWGTEDDVTPPAAQAEKFYPAIKRAGALTRIAPVAGAPHYWYSEDPSYISGGFSAFLATRVTSFLENCCSWSVQDHF